MPRCTAILKSATTTSPPGTIWSSGERLIAAALADPVKSTRLVTLAVGWNASGALAAIIDEGAGYPHAARHSHLPDSARLATGRGLVIARAAGGVRVLRGGRCTRLTICRLPPSVTHA